MSAEEQTPEPAYDWRLVKQGVSVTLELGDKFADLEGPELTYLTRVIGKALINVGTRFLESHVEDDDYDEEGEGW